MYLNIFFLLTLKLVTIEIKDSTIENYGSKKNWCIRQVKNYPLASYRTSDQKLSLQLLSTSLDVL